ncbi:MAG: glycosyltransferase family A protein [Bryobacteraceae bacterium]|nr:glycosyltransferase family A protein [Bryobacteraceae bacterium]
MKVSIIIDSYNYQDYLPVSIESALAQTYPDVEVIVVDDGSTDGSVREILRFGNRVEAVLKPNGGQASAFNAGWRRAKGDIILFLDCDDALKPDAVERVVAAWRPGYSKLHFPLTVTDQGLRPAGAMVPRAALPAGNLKAQVLEQGIYVSPPTSGNAFSRQYLEAVLPMPETDWIQAADAYLVALAPLHGEIGAIHTPLGYYRTHEASTTNMAALDTRKLTQLLEYDIRLMCALRTYTERNGLPLGPEAGRSHWLHLKLRLASCRLAGTEHPYPKDRVWKLARRLVRSALSAGELSMGMRAAFAAWAVAVAGLPVPVSGSLVHMAFSPTRRPSLLRMLIGGKGAL